MTRRMFVSAAAASAAASAAVTPRTAMGIASTSYLSFWRPRETMALLDHAIELGAGGIQMALNPATPESIRALRAKLESSGRYYETMVPLPSGDPAAFTTTLRNAKEAGALCARCGALSGRRYETFKTLDEWKAFVAASKAKVKMAVAAAEKEKLPLALENHKDWTIDEMVALLKEYESEYLGVTLDTGNNIALCDDPMEVVRALMPYTVTTHLKDMGLEPAADGFLLSEMPFGEGYLDIQAIIAEVRAKKPKAKLTLEMITRNPLRVPVLTDGYWATFPGRDARYLQKTLNQAMSLKKDPLPRVDHLDKTSQLKLEVENVRQCLFWARERLGV